MQSLSTFLWLLPILLVSMVLHELAHAVVADRLGDPTPRITGRLTANPISHLDPLGTLMFGITYFATPSFIFGWARPVRVFPGNFRSPQRGMALVAIAGPVTNFVIAYAFLVVYRNVTLSGRLADVIVYAVIVNVVLGVFNLIPIPPLDGSRVVGAFMNDATYRRWSALDSYGVFVLLGLYFLFRSQSLTLLSSAQNTALDTISLLPFA